MKQTRREVLKLTAGAVIAAPIARRLSASAATSQAATSAAPALRFFTRKEFGLVDELTEIIIPTDAHSPGARAARVAAFLDQQLADAFEDEPRSTWRVGLQAVDSLSNELHGKPFLAGTSEERTAVVARLAKGEADPKTPGERFFTELKRRTAYAYYTSEIGIRQEIEYKGNTLLTEFVGEG
jgi:hypothetical protein